MQRYSLISYWWYGWPRLIYSTRRWWEHLHETPEEREAHIAATKKRYREVWEQHKREAWDPLPETRELMEMRAELDELMDEVLGKE